MKEIKLTKDEHRQKNIILIITAIITCIISFSFFLQDMITIINSCELFYIIMLIYFSLEFTNYLLTRKLTQMHHLYTSIACIIASASGVLYMNEPTNLVLTFTLIGWMIMMLIIKLIQIEQLRNELNNGVFINIFIMSIFILLGFLTITNLYKGIANTGMMLGFFFVVYSILNLLETISTIKFSTR